MKSVAISFTYIFEVHLKKRFLYLFSIIYTNNDLKYPLNLFLFVNFTALVRFIFKYSCYQINE